MNHLALNKLVILISSEEDDNRLAAVQKSGVSAICDGPFDPGSVRNLLCRLME